MRMGLRTFLIAGVTACMVYIQSSVSASAESTMSDETVRQVITSITQFQAAHGCVPVEIGQLVREGFLDDIPLNPLTGKSMDNVRIDDPQTSGNYTYIPLITDYCPHDSSKQHTFTILSGYLLMFYQSPGISVDVEERTKQCAEMFSLPNLLTVSRIYGTTDIISAKRTDGAPIPKYRDLVTALVENGYAAPSAESSRW